MTLPAASAPSARAAARPCARPHGSLQLTAALALAALILYIPANIYPILRMHFYGAYSEGTVWDGVVVPRAVGAILSWR